MILRRSLAAALVSALAGCTYAISGPNGKPLAVCHDGAFTSFCVVKKDKDDAVVTGSGIVPTSNTSSGLVTEGVAIGELIK